MRRIADSSLLLLQWALVVMGLLTVLVTLQSYRVEAAFVASLPRVQPDSDTYYYAPPLFQRLTVGVTSGLFSIGLGAVLFYLRRLYLARRGT